MQYFIEISILCVFLLLGTILRKIIPLPIPESVYGMILLYIAFSLKILKPDQIRKTAEYLLSIMPLFFVPYAVNLMDSYELIKGKVVFLILMIILSTAFTIVVSGKVVESMQRRRKDV